MENLTVTFINFKIFQQQLCSVRSGKVLSLSCFSSKGWIRALTFGLGEHQGSFLELGVHLSEKLTQIHILKD